MLTQVRINPYQTDMNPENPQEPGKKTVTVRHPNRKTVTIRDKPARIVWNPGKPSHTARIQKYEPQDPRNRPSIHPRTLPT